MSSGTVLPPSESQKIALGWACSFMLHGLALMVVVSWLTGLRLPPQREPFRWEVALVQHKAETQPATAERTIPPKPRSRSTGAAVSNLQNLTTQPIIAEQRTPSRPLPTSATVPQPRHATVQPIQAQAIQQRRESTPETTRAESTIPQIVQARVERVQSVMSPAAPVHRTVVSERAAAVDDDRRVDVVEHAVHAGQPLTRESAPATEAAETAVTQQATLPAGPMASPGTPALTRRIVQAGGGTTPTERPTTVHGRSVAREVISRSDGASPPRTISTEPDYGWLAESLWRRVQALKRYPAKAAADRLEGEILLAALVRANGEIVDVRIAESSGSPLLDEAAVETVRKASPLALTKPLTRAQVSIEVPIAYYVE